MLSSWCNGRAHGYELFRCCWVDTDGRVELSLGGAAIDCHRQPLDDFTGVRANHVAADDSVGCVIDDDFHHRSFIPAA